MLFRNVWYYRFSQENFGSQKMTKIRPNWKMIAIDASEYCDCEETTKIVGKIADVYIYDCNQVTCYLITPSYELLWLKTAVERSHSEDEALQEKIDNILNILNQEQTWITSYRHCKGIDALPQMTLVDFNTLSDEEWSKIIKEISNDGEIPETDWDWETYIKERYRPDEKEPPLPWE